LELIGIDIVPWKDPPAKNPRAAVMLGDCEGVKETVPEKPFSD
jgi:hypothetical protein